MLFGRAGHFGSVLFNQCDPGFVGDHYGLYRSRNGGLSWEMISELEFPYMDFAAENKGFGLAGGPYVTYDGGMTWLLQSEGSGYCCHYNNLWAFDTTHAIWHDHPNASIFTYVEPWEPNFEVLPGVPIKNGYVESGDTNVPVASYKFLNHGPVPIRLESLTVRTSSACTYANDISQVKLWLDGNANGYVDEEDTQLSTGAYSADSGALPLILGEELILTQFIPVHLLLTYDLAGDLYPLRTSPVMEHMAGLTASPLCPGASALSSGAGMRAPP